MKKIGYLDSTSAPQEEVDECYERDIICYENAIMFYCGHKLWKNSRNTEREHRKYSFSTIRKRYTMSIVDFNNRMIEYGNTLEFLQPPTRKGHTKSSEADWEALKSITKSDIRVATFYAIPVEYRNHIESQYESDYRDMQEGEFLDAMISYEKLTFP